MKAIRNSFWAALALAAVVGCDEPTKPADSSAAPPAASAPGGPAEAKKPEAKPEDKKPEAKPEDKKTEAKPEEKKADTKEAKKLTDDQIAEIKKLPEAEQKIALAQMTCPIGNDNLGEMGMPVKVVLNGQTVFLCCKGCVKDAEKDPAGTLAKLGKK